MILITFCKFKIETFIYELVQEEVSDAEGKRFIPEREVKDGHRQWPFLFLVCAQNLCTRVDVIRWWSGNCCPE